MTQHNPVFIFGAGASKACGGPLTDEILFEAFHNESINAAMTRDRRGDVDAVWQCLRQLFHVTRQDAPITEFPSLTLLLSILDLSIERNRTLPRKMPQFPKSLGRQELSRARAAIEYIIFSVLDYHLRTPPGRAYRDILSSPMIDANEDPRAISLNYDIVLDTLMCSIAQQHLEDAVPDYCCDIRTPAYVARKRHGRLLKLHGSLNWLFCPGCQRLDIGMSKNGKELADSSFLEELYNFKPLEQHYLCGDDSCNECQCKYCGTPLRAVMITPSFAKDYRNPHIQKVWYEAEWLLRESTHAVIVGYSLPNDDLEVIHLLRRGLRELPPENITVVLREPDDAICRRYRSHFGSNVDFQLDGFEKWAHQIADSELLSRSATS